MEHHLTNQEIEEYAAHFKQEHLLDLKRTHYTAREHQQCKNNFTAKMKTYNERTLANYNQAFDLFCLAVHLKRCNVKIAKQRDTFKAELKEARYMNRMLCT